MRIIILLLVISIKSFSQPGSYYQVNSLSQPFVTPEMFGAKGDGVNDDSPAINAACSYAISTGSIREVRFSSKNYKINSPIILFSNDVSGNYQTFNLDLIGDVNANAGVSSKCTTITCNFNNTFAIGIQTARSCTIKNILIIGQYSNGGKTFKQICEDAASTWINTARDTQYSPYAGIIIDPFGTSVPSDGGYPGLSSYYKSSAGGSSGITIENCSINNFVVDFALSINGTTSNAESINLYKCRLFNSKVAYAVGQDQTRGCSVNDSFILGCYTALDAVSYGLGIGSSPELKNIIFSNLRSILNIQTIRGSFSGIDLYAEAVWRIGVVSGNTICSFRGCRFKFNYGNSPDYVLAPDALIPGGSKIDFYSCYFTKSGDQTGNFPIGDCKPYFYYCQFECINALHQYVSYATYNNCSTINNIDITSGEKLGLNFNPTFSYNGVIYKKNLNSISQSITHHILPSGNSYLQIGTNITVTISGNTASFTPPDVTKIKVGDIIMAGNTLPYAFTYSGTSDSNPTPMIGTVSSIVGGVVTIKDISYDLISGQSFTLYTIWTDVYSGAIMGTTTNGSNVITNVFKESGASLVGARIYSADPQLFPYGLYVVSENTGASTLTLSGNLNSSQTSIGLYTAYYEQQITVGADPSTLTGMFVEKGTIIKSRGTNLTDKAYLVTTSGIVGNATHTPTFKTITVQ